MLRVRYNSNKPDSALEKRPPARALRGPAMLGAGKGPAKDKGTGAGAGNRRLSQPAAPRSLPRGGPARPNPADASPRGAAQRSPPDRSRASTALARAMDYVAVS